MLSVLWVPVFTSVTVLAIRSVSASAHFTEGPAPFDGGVRGGEEDRQGPCSPAAAVWSKAGRVHMSTHE